MVDVLVFTMPLDRSLGFVSALTLQVQFAHAVCRSEDQTHDAPQVLNFTMEV